MNAKELSKEAILHACMIKQQLTIADFEEELKSIQNDLSDHAESPSQAHRGSGGQQELILRLKHELNFLQREKHTLESINPGKSMDQVGLGAVVYTDQRIFFISTSIEQVVVNGRSVFGISTQAPIYKEMRGKRAGEHFEFKGIRYQIETIA